MLRALSLLAPTDGPVVDYVSLFKGTQKSAPCQRRFSTKLSESYIYVSDSAHFVNEHAHCCLKIHGIV